MVALAVIGSGPAVADPFATGALVPVSGASPIAACEGDTGFRDVGGVPANQFVNSEVEPHVMVDPSNPDIIIGAWQQDRWNNGGSEGNVSATSLDGGASWTINALTKSSNCTGGTPANGGNFERASDPWVAISPDGTAYLMSLSTDTAPGGFDTNPDDMLVTRSTDHGATWEDPVSLNRDESPNAFNDKNAITADPNDSDFVYAVWDLVVSPPSGNQNQQAFENAIAFAGDPLFARTTDGGETWEPARRIFRAGVIAQTIGNQIAVLPDNDEFDGELVNVFTLIRGARNDQGTGGTHIAVIRSSDQGATWDKKETIVDRFFRGIVIDPDSPLPAGVVASHRTGDINAEDRRGPDHRRGVSGVAGQPVRPPVQHRVQSVPRWGPDLVDPDQGEPDAGSGEQPERASLHADGPGAGRRHRGCFVLRLPQQHRRQRRHHSHRSVYRPLPPRLCGLLGGSELG